MKNNNQICWQSLIAWLTLIIGGIMFWVKILL